MKQQSALYTLFAVVVVDLIGFGVVVPILPFFAESYGASATVLGFLLTSYALMQLIFAPLWGRLSDRIGRRPVMLLTIAGTAVALFMLGCSKSLTWLFASRILGGVFSANISVAGAFIGDVTAEEERTRWMGMIGAAFGIGFLLGPALGGGLAPRGFHVPMFVAAGLAAVNFVMAAIFLPEPERHRSQTSSTLRSSRALRDPLILRICVAGLLFSLAISQLETIFAFYMLHRFGYDARQVAYLLVWMAFIMILVQGGGIRKMVPRFGERKLVMAGSALLIPSLAAIPWSPSVAFLLLPLSIASFARGISHPSMLGLISKASSAEQRGLVMGAFQSSASLARVLGPLAAGFLFDWHYSLPFALAGLLMVSVFVISTSLPRSSEATDRAIPEPIG